MHTAVVAEIVAFALQKPYGRCEPLLPLVARLCWPAGKLRYESFIQIVVLPLITLWDLGTSQAVLACGAAQVVGLRIPSLGSAGISA